MRSSLGLSAALVAALLMLAACGGQSASPDSPSFSISTNSSLSEAVTSFVDAMPVLDESIDDVCTTVEVRNGCAPVLAAEAQRCVHRKICMLSP